MSKEIDGPTKQDQSLAGGANDGMGKLEFLQLLTAQLQHQDPMDPMDDKQFIAQLAQFTSLEQSMQTNKKLDELNMAMGGMASAQVTGLIGKSVVAHGDTMTLREEGEETLMQFDLDRDADEVTIEVVDGMGRAIRTMNLSERLAGKHAEVWDGKTDDGAPAPAGVYHIAVKARDQEGEVPSSTQIEGEVDGVDYKSGLPMVMIGGARVPPSDVIEIKNRTQGADLGASEDVSTGKQVLIGGDS